MDKKAADKLVDEIHPRERIRLEPLMENLDKLFKSQQDLEHKVQSTILGQLNLQTDSLLLQKSRELRQVADSTLVEMRQYFGDADFDQERARQDILSRAIKILTTPTNDTKSISEAEKALMQIEADAVAFGTVFRQLSKQEKIDLNQIKGMTMREGISGPVLTSGDLRGAVAEVFEKLDIKTLMTQTDDPLVGKMKQIYTDNWQDQDQDMAELLPDKLPESLTRDNNPRIPLLYFDPDHPDDPQSTIENLIGFMRFTDADEGVRELGAVNIDPNIAVSILLGLFSSRN